MKLQPSRFKKVRTATIEKRRLESGVMLPEVMISVVLMGVMMAAIVSGFMSASLRSEWSGYSLAGHSLALQGMEQARSAKWDPLQTPPYDDLVVNSTNFNPRSIVLDIPISGTNMIYGTNTWTITLVSTDPPLKMIRVDCTWPFGNKRTTYTNTIVTLRSPSQ